MAIHTDLPIYKSSYELLQLATALVKNFPRSIKVSIGQAIQDACVRICLLVAKANAAADKIPHLGELLEHQREAELLIRLAKDSKTQTRRVVKLRGHDGIQSDHSRWRHLVTDSLTENQRKLADEGHIFYWQNLDNKGRLLYEKSPYGKPGDLLWVRETHSIRIHPEQATDGCGRAWYRADSDMDGMIRWKPSIHMPRWASRIALEITNVRVEQLRDINEMDAYDEGTQTWASEVVQEGNKFPSVVAAYRALWESINGTGSWDSNPFVWVIEFQRAIP